MVAMNNEKDWNEFHREWEYILRNKIPKNLYLEKDEMKIFKKLIKSLKETMYFNKLDMAKHNVNQIIDFLKI